MNLLKSCLTTTAIVFSLVSCKKSNDNAVTPINFNGKWVEHKDEDSPPYAFAGSTTTYYFEGDSVKIKYDWFTDAIAEDDPCGTSKTYFSKGLFKFKNDSLQIEAKYTTDDFEQYEANCRGDETYSNAYKILFLNKDYFVVNLNSPQPKYFKRVN